MHRCSQLQSDRAQTPHSGQLLNTCKDSSQTQPVTLWKVRQGHNMHYTTHAADADWHLTSLKMKMVSLEQCTLNLPTAECANTVTSCTWVSMMAYSKSLQHSLSNTASSHCAHHLVLQVKRTAPIQARLNSNCNMVSACNISNNIASDTTDSSLHRDHTSQLRD